MNDARFEDAAERPLRLRALDADDLRVISAAVQDAVLPATELAWDRRRRCFALLVNRLRRETAMSEGPPERVRAMLVLHDVQRVATQGVDRADTDLVLSILSMDWEAGDDGSGRVVLTLAGDGAIAVDVEALEVTLTDVTRPYRAVSGKLPDHGV